MFWSGVQGSCSHTKVLEALSAFRPDLVDTEGSITGALFLQEGNRAWTWWWDEVDGPWGQA